MNSWMEQSKQWFESWAGAQQALWAGWQQGTQSATPAGEGTPEFWTQWQTLAMQSMDAYSDALTGMIGDGSGWNAFTQQWQKWIDNITQAGGAAPLRAMEEALTPWLESPPLGMTREVERLLRQLFQSSLTLQSATAEYQAVLGDAWLNISRLMQQALSDSERPPIESMADVAALWGEVADPAFLDIFRSERYIRAQGALLQATMQVRLRQRAIAETVAEMVDLPTRTEVDAAHKINYEQNKAIKALRKELEAMEARLERLEAKPARRTTRKKAATAKKKEA